HAGHLAGGVHADGEYAKALLHLRPLEDRTAVTGRGESDIAVPLDHGIVVPLDERAPGCGLVQTHECTRLVDAGRTVREVRAHDHAAVATRSRLDAVIPRARTLPDGQAQLGITIEAVVRAPV